MKLKDRLKSKTSKVQAPSGKLDLKSRPSFSVSGTDALFLALLPIGAASFYYKVNSLPPVEVTPLVEIQPVSSRVRPILPPPRQEVALKPAEPVAPVNPVDELVKVPPEVSAPETAPIAETAPPEPEDVFDELEKFNVEANRALQKNMALAAKSATGANTIERWKAPPVKQRWTYSFQDLPQGAVKYTYQSKQPSLTSVADPVRPERVPAGLLVAPNPTCDLRRIPARPDPYCKANYPCRFCGGCCCRSEAHLATLGK